MNTANMPVRKRITGVISRSAMKAVLAPLVRWDRMSAPDAGYTVVIAAMHRLMPVARANLTCLARQKLQNCRQLVLVFDCPAGQVPTDLADNFRRAHPGVDVAVLGYSPVQTRVARAFDWGWVYAWMSWSIGLAHAQTRHAMLHDFDALLLNAGAVEDRYAAALERQAEYVGVRHYFGNGIAPSDGLVTTFQLMLDVAHVRERHRPIDLFNHVGQFNGRWVEFDTFLYAQSRGGTKSVLDIPESDMVHPSQMICQYTDFMVRPWRLPDRNNLLMFPYYAFVGGDAGPIISVTRGLGSGSPSVELFGKQADVSRLPPEHFTWLADQVERCERSLVGANRPEAQAFAAALRRRVPPAATSA